MYELLHHLQNRDLSACFDQYGYGKAGYIKLSLS